MALSSMQIVRKGAVGERTREVGQDIQGSEVYVKGVGLDPGGCREPLKWGVQSSNLRFRKVTRAAV